MTRVGFEAGLDNRRAGIEMAVAPAEKVTLLRWRKLQSQAMAAAEVLQDDCENGVDRRSVDISEQLRAFYEWYFHTLNIQYQKLWCWLICCHECT